MDDDGPDYWQQQQSEEEQQQREDLWKRARIAQNDLNELRREQREASNRNRTKASVSNRLPFLESWEH